MGLIAKGLLLGTLLLAGPVSAQMLFRPFERVTAAMSSPQAVVAADVNGDGRDDAIVATTEGTEADSLNDHRLHVFLQGSGGSFAAPVRIVYDIYSSFASLAVADMNEDGVQDTLVVHSQGVSVMLGSRTGAFTVKQTWWGDGFSRSYGGSLVAIDANLDGHMDVVAAATGGGATGPIWVFYGDGKGGLTAATGSLATPGYNFSSGARVGKGDLNHDGMQDLVIAAYNLHVMLHDGASGFAAPTVFSSGRSVHAVGDFSGDGRDDVALYDGGTNLLFYNQNASATFDYAGYTPVADSNALSRPTVADVDRDGAVDLLTTSPYENVIDYYRQPAAGGLVYESTFAIPPKPTYAETPFAAGDVNGDGRTDLVVADAAGLAVLYGRRYQRTGLTIRNDFNGDGRADLLWRRDASGQATIWRGAVSTASTAVTTSGLDWYVVGTNDFDGDGRSDMLFRNRRTGSNVIWKSGNSATPQAVAAVTDLAWIVAGTGDFDADGCADILWRNTRTGSNAVWRSANSALALAVTGVTNLAWQVVAIGDYDGDDRSDIFWRNGQTGTNAIWRSGNSASQIAVTGVTNLAWQIVGTGDFDGDGRFDVLWRNASTGANVVWRSGNYETQWSLATTSSPWKVAAIADFDGNGRSDIVWRHTQNGTNLWWKAGESADYQMLASVSDQAWQVAY
jgi:hypothetical protein